MPEHHVEFREAKIEGVVLVNQRHFDAVTKNLREDGGKFQPAKSGSENEDALLHCGEVLFLSSQVKRAFDLPPELRPGWSEKFMG